MNRIKTFLFLGGPGCGKGTVCERLAEKFQCHHMSVGKLLRKVPKSSPNYETIQNCINQAKIVPSVISCNLIQEELKYLDSFKGLLVDGFPRNFENYEKWNSTLSDIMDLQNVFHMKCSDETLLQRCMARDHSRTDDAEDVIKKRILHYHTDTLPLLLVFKTRKLLVDIDASKSEDEVYREVEKHVQLSLYA